MLVPIDTPRLLGASVAEEPPATNDNTDDAAADLAREIRRRRKAAGLSQPKLAKRLGYTHQYVSLAERIGQNLPSQELVRALDAALNADGALLALREQAKAEQRARRHTSDVALTSPRQESSTFDYRMAIARVGKSSPLTLRKIPSPYKQITTTPSREEISMAADESASFGNWIAGTNVDTDVLDQMDTDVSDIARRYLFEPPATIFSKTLQARKQVFELIASKQPPRLTIRLYKVAGQLCGLLAHISADLGYGHAANTHARTALRCAELGEYPHLVGYVRWVQSNVAYWNGEFDVAAELVETATRSAPKTGITQLRLASQRARIEARRNRVSDVRAALSQVEKVPTVPLIEEQGDFSFTAGKAAYYASEAHRELGDAASLDAAVRWAEISITELSGQPDARTSTSLIAAARFDLARAHLARGNLDAVSEQIVPILSETNSGFRTVPVITRARDLQKLLSVGKPAEAEPIIAIRDGLDRFCISPAEAPSELVLDADD
jgi:transcriptional regulator with XRE-family HTH domain